MKKLICSLLLLCSFSVAQIQRKMYIAMPQSSTPNTNAVNTWLLTNSLSYSNLVAGINYACQWKNIEATINVYDFRSCGNAMGIYTVTPYFKKLSLQTQAISESVATGNQSAPDYVLNDSTTTTCTCTSYNKNDYSSGPTNLISVNNAGVYVYAASDANSNANGYAGFQWTITGFNIGGNNVTAQATASTSTTITLAVTTTSEVHTGLATSVFNNTTAGCSQPGGQFFSKGGILDFVSSSYAVTRYTAFEDAVAQWLSPACHTGPHTILGCNGDTGITNGATGESLGANHMDYVRVNGPTYGGEKGMLCYAGKPPTYTPLDPNFSKASFTAIVNGFTASFAASRVTYCGSLYPNAGCRWKIDENTHSGQNDASDKTFADSEAAAASAQGVGISNNGVQHGDVVNYPVCNANYCNNDKTYDYVTNAMIQFQTLSTTDPNGSGRLPQTGSLAELLPFMIARTGTGVGAPTRLVSYEAFSTDPVYGLVDGPSGGCTNWNAIAATGADFNTDITVCDATSQAAYYAAISNFINAPGLSGMTNQVNGNIVVTGNITIN